MEISCHPVSIRISFQKRLPGCFHSSESKSKFNWPSLSKFSAISFSLYIFKGWQFPFLLCFIQHYCKYLNELKDSTFLARCSNFFLRVSSSVHESIDSILEFIDTGWSQSIILIISRVGSGYYEILKIFLRVG